MKNIYVVIPITENGKFYAIAEKIKTGKNLIPFIKAYNTDIVHLCESRRQAETIAAHWNETFKNNGTHLFQ